MIIYERRRGLEHNQKQLTFNSSGISIQDMGRGNSITYIFSDELDAIESVQLFFNELGIKPSSLFSDDELMALSKMLTALAEVYMETIGKEKKRLERLEQSLSSVLNYVQRISSLTEVTSVKEDDGKEEVIDPDGSGDSD